MPFSRFSNSLSAEGANINWTEGPKIYGRWKCAADMASAVPSTKGLLLLESIILPEDSPMENLAPAKKESLAKGSATTFVLW